MPSWKKVITSGSDAVLNSILSSGAITGSDVQVDDWGSVSASLASLDASIYGDSDVTSHINSLDVHSGSHLGTADTDDLSEGSTNLYYTDTRVKDKLDVEGVLSGSSQVSFNGIIDKPTLVSGSSQIDINSTNGDLTTLGTVTTGDVSAILPNGVISGSSQVSFNGIIDKPTLVSGSSQIDINSTNGDLTTLGTVTTGDVSAILPNGVVSGSDQLTGSLVDLTSNQTISGDKTFTNVAINGTASIQYLQSITGSAKIVGDAYVVLNAESPTERYSGLKVYDSGSGDTGSLEYDSLSNHWFYESTTEGYASGLIAGPRDSRGNITFPPYNRIVKGIGGNHVSASSISDNGTTITLGNNTEVEGTLNISTVSNAGTDTDKFLVLDSNGNVDFRTGTEVRSDIGAAGAANLNGAPSELAYFGSSTEVTSSRRIALLNTASSDAQSLLVQGQIQVINDPTRNVGGSSPMQIQVGSGSSGDINNPQYDSFISMEQESATQVALRANGDAPTAAQFKMRTDVNDAYSIGRLTNPYGANTFRIKPTLIAEGGLSITGSLTISGSNTLRNIGPAEFSGSVSINTADQVQASTDTDKFLVLDGDQIKYRSGTQVRSDIGAASSAVTLQNVTDNGNSTTNVIQMPNFTLSSPTNNGTSSDKILVLDGSKRSKFRTRDELRDDIGALQASRTPQMVVTSAEVLDPAITDVFIPFSGINIFPETNTTAYSRFHAPYDGYIKEIIVHPHEAGTSGTCTITPTIDGSGTTGVQETISATAGTSTTFSFGAAGYSFSDGDSIHLAFDREASARSKGFSFTIVFIMDATS